MTSLFTKPTLWEIPTIPESVYENLNNKVTELKQRLVQIAENHQSARFASSLAVEDLLITDVIAKNQLNIRVFTLDTKKLNPETLDLLATIRGVYPQLDFQIFTPNEQEAADFEAKNGAFAFYDSVEMRRECCRIRKIVPLNNALMGADCWLTGQRREQSATRTELPFAEKDNSRGIDKYNPIFDWSELEVWAYILRENVPYNDMYHQGYPSIGCEPCTRPVKVGEDIRAGRWWWENKDSKECGLHK